MPYQLKGPVLALDGAFEHHFVVNLKQELPAEVPELFVPLDFKHGQHGDVRRPALDRGVDGCPLEVLPHARAPAVDLVQVPVPPQQRAHALQLVRLHDSLVLPRLHLGPVPVPPVQRFVRLPQGNLPIFREPVGRLAVGDGEVEDFGLPPLRGEHVLDQRHGRGLVGLATVPLQQALPFVNGLLDVLVHAQRRPAVEVAAALKSIQHAHAARHVRQEPQLQLPVISDDQRLARLDVGGEGLSDLVPVLLQGRLILQVWPPGAQPARLGVDVHAAVDSALLALDRVALQGDDEVAQQRVDRGDIAEGVHGCARPHPFPSSPKSFVRLAQPLAGRLGVRKGQVLLGLAQELLRDPRGPGQNPKHRSVRARPARGRRVLHGQGAGGVPAPEAVQLYVDVLQGLLLAFLDEPGLVGNFEDSHHLHFLHRLLVLCPRVKQLPQLERAAHVDELCVRHPLRGPLPEELLRLPLVLHRHLLDLPQVLLVSQHTLALHVRQQASKGPPKVGVKLVQVHRLPPLDQVCEHRRHLHAVPDAVRLVQVALQGVVQVPGCLGV
mmetsp:Transcript_15744/g.40064  ORF Transcript_15744/g.40064 Transcript_15744/m.40064 type:complete len:551 (-) Transcript_15744:628-2280(-)